MRRTSLAYIAVRVKRVSIVFMAGLIISESRGSNIVLGGSPMTIVAGIFEKHVRFGHISSIHHTRYEEECTEYECDRSPGFFYFSFS